MRRGSPKRSREAYENTSHKKTSYELTSHRITENVVNFLMQVVLFAGYDVIAQAQSGTGKTATFSIAILEHLDVSLFECQALILAPTRELAQQVCIT